MSNTGKANKTGNTGAMTRSARAFTATLLVVAAVVSPGCWPKQLVVWSPDGKLAVVMSAESTDLCNGEGKFFAQDIGTVRAAAWMPNSGQVLLAVAKAAENWKELSAAIDEPTRQAIIDGADNLEKAILAIPAGKELSDKDGERILASALEGRGSLAPAALIYLRDTRPDALRKILGKKWKGMQEAAAHYTQLRLYELDGSSLKAGLVILNSLKGVEAARLSPDGRAVAYVTGSDRTDDSLALWVAPVAAGAAPRELADQVAIRPDWSADGRYVAYIRAAAAPEQTQGRSLQLGAVARRRVTDESGALLTDLPAVEDLAGLLFTKMLSVRCLADGRIVFSAADVTLPATAADMPQRVLLFAFDPARPATLTRLIPRQREGDMPLQMLFELNPDQKLISIAGDDARACILNLANGDVTWVQNAESKTRMLPSWRPTNRLPGELCFIIPAAKNEPDSRPEVGLWSAGKTRIISKDWPDKVMKNLTFSPSGKPPPTTAPATEPRQADADS